MSISQNLTAHQFLNFEQVWQGFDEVGAACVDFRKEMWGFFLFLFGQCQVHDVTQMLHSLPVVLPNNNFTRVEISSGLNIFMAEILVYFEIYISFKLIFIRFEK